MPDLVPVPVSLPPWPDEGEQCVTDTPYILTAICVNGLRQLAWVLASEIQNDPPFAAAVGKAPCGGCAKTALLELARQNNWSAKDTIAALKVLGEK